MSVICFAFSSKVYFAVGMAKSRAKISKDFNYPSLSVIVLSCLSCWCTSTLGLTILMRLILTGSENSISSQTRLLLGDEEFSNDCACCCC